MVSISSPTCEATPFFYNSLYCFLRKASEDLLKVLLHRVLGFPFPVYQGCPDFRRDSNSQEINFSLGTQ